MKHLYLFLILSFAFNCQSGPFIDENINIDDKSTFSLIKTESDMTHTVLQGFDKRIWLLSIDNKSLFRLSWDVMYPYEAYITPGFHKITVRYNHMYTFAIGCLTLNAEGNKEYIVRRKQVSINNNEYILFWIEDTQTKENVGNKCSDN